MSTLSIIFFVSLLGTGGLVTLKMLEIRLDRKVILGKIRAYVDRISDAAPHIISRESKLLVASISLKCHKIIGYLHNLVGTMRGSLRRYTIKLLSAAHSEATSKQSDVSVFLRHLSKEHDA